MSGIVDDLAVESEELDRPYIERRIDDWHARIVGLYRDATNWLGPDFSTSESQSVRMNEELMRRHNIPAIDLPILAIYKNNSFVGRFVPKGLWIIGANGRIDFFKAEKQFIIIDRSNEIGFVDWQIASAEHRRALKNFNSTVLTEIVNS